MKLTNDRLPGWYTSRPVQPVAGEQHVARDTVFSCPRRESLVEVFMIKKLICESTYASLYLLTFCLTTMCIIL